MNREVARNDLSVRPEMGDMLHKNNETIAFPTLFDTPQRRIDFLVEAYTNNRCKEYIGEATHRGINIPKGIFELPTDVFRDYIMAMSNKAAVAELPGKIKLQELFATTSPDNPELEEQRSYARK